MCRTMVLEILDSLGCEPCADVGAQKPVFSSGGLLIDLGNRTPFLLLQVQCRCVAILKTQNRLFDNLSLGWENIYPAGRLGEFP